MNRPGIADVTVLAYSKRHENEETNPRCWRIRTKVLVISIIYAVLGCLIVYWLVSQIIENRRQNWDETSVTGGKSSEKLPSHLKRLSNHVLPMEYTLKIIPILEEDNFTFIGDLQIQMYCKIPTKKIRLHARKLIVKDIVVKEYNKPDVTKAINKYSYTDKDFIDIFLLQVLIPGESYVLRIKYVGRLDRQPEGLFRSSYVNHMTNKTRWIAVSNFSPDFARQAFPCFDEPWMKTPFRISIGRRTNMISHSNSMRKFIEEIPDMPGYVWDHYEKTLPMSTYLIAFMVTDFSQKVVDRREARPSYNIFSREEIQNNITHIEFLLPRVLEFIQNLTEFHYELDKLDIIIVPELSYPAMENWGLITLRENDVIINEKMIYPNEKNTISSMIIAHEIAHQWFGNLVTPNWWSDVWLKEAFSTFFGNWALKVIEPLLNIRKFEQCRNMLEMDGSEWTHPLHVNVSGVTKLTNIFDSIPYFKGDCVVNMIFHSLRESTFLSSIRRYLRDHYYRSADQDDLWHSFQEQINFEKLFKHEFNVRDIMRSWTDQSGYPVLQIQRNQSTGYVTLVQKRFFNENNHFNNVADEIWSIPLTWKTENYDSRIDNDYTKTWLTERSMNMYDSHLGQAVFQNKWILFNVDRLGYYRVNYDEENWKLLTDAFHTFNEITKAQLFNDVSAMVHANLTNHSIMWQLFQQMRIEDGEILWETVGSILKSITIRLQDSSVFKLNICRIVDKVYTTKAKSLTHTRPQLWTRFQMEVMKLACSVGHKTCSTATRSLVFKMLRNESSVSIVPRDFRTWAYCAFITDATDDQWSMLIQRYNDPKSTKDCSLAYALACHGNTILLKSYLLSIFVSNENHTITENCFDQTIISMVRNPRGYQIARDFIIEYGQEIVKYDGSYDVLTTILDELSMRMDREEDINWLMRLERSHIMNKMILNQVKDAVKKNIIWNQQHRYKILEILGDITKGQVGTRDCVKGGRKD